MQRLWRSPYLGFVGRATTAGSRCESVGCPAAPSQTVALRRHPWHLFHVADRSTTTADEREAANFSRIGWKWWDTEHNSSVRPLHAMNTTRVAFIRECLEKQQLSAQGGRGVDRRRPLSGLRVLDVGCGGGILSESIARLGASVHGIDINQAS
jgi:hypothetical protein